MEGRRRTIEIDEDVAVALEERAAARDTTVDVLLAEFAAGPHVVQLTDQEEAELDEILLEWERTRLGVPAEEVLEWMKSWGGGERLPPPKLRRL